MWTLQARNAKKGWWRFWLKSHLLPPSEIGMHHRDGTALLQVNTENGGRNNDCLFLQCCFWSPCLCVCQSAGFCSEQLPVIIRADCCLPGTEHDSGLPAGVALVKQLMEEELSDPRSSLANFQPQHKKHPYRPLSSRHNGADGRSTLSVTTHELVW